MQINNVTCAYSAAAQVRALREQGHHVTVIAGTPHEGAPSTADLLEAGAPINLIGCSSANHAAVLLRIVLSSWHVRAVCQMASEDPSGAPGQLYVRPRPGATAGVGTLG